MRNAFLALGPMSTTALSTRRPRGINSKGRNLQQLIRENRFKLSENLEMAGVNDLLEVILGRAAREPKLCEIRNSGWCFPILR